MARWDALRMVARMVSHIPLPPRLDYPQLPKPHGQHSGLVEIVEEDEDGFAPLEEIEVEDVDFSEDCEIENLWIEIASSLAGGFIYVPEDVMRTPN